MCAIHGGQGLSRWGRVKRTSFEAPQSALVSSLTILLTERIRRGQLLLLHCCSVPLGERATSSCFASSATLASSQRCRALLWRSGICYHRAWVLLRLAAHVCIPCCSLCPSPLQCRLRGRIDSNGSVAAYLEERLNLGVNLLFSAEVHVKTCLFVFVHELASFIVSPLRF